MTVSSLLGAVEAGASAAFDAYVQQTPLGAEERGALTAVMTAFKSESILDAIAAAEEVLKVIADLKAAVSAAANPVVPQ
jgi:hypothetical protein